MHNAVLTFELERIYNSYLTQPVILPVCKLEWNRSRISSTFCPPSYDSDIHDGNQVLGKNRDAEITHEGRKIVNCECIIPAKRVIMILEENTDGRISKVS